MSTLIETERSYTLTVCDHNITSNQVSGRIVDFDRFGLELELSKKWHHFSKGDIVWIKWSLVTNIKEDNSGNQGTR